MSIPSTLTKYAALLLLLSAVAAASLLGHEAVTSAPVPSRVQLSKPVEISVSGLEIDAAALLPDNKIVVLVGGQPRGPQDSDRAIEDAPPAGAIVNLRTKAVRRFTNGHTIRIKSVACPADGSRIVTAGTDKDPFVRIRDVKAGKRLSHKGWGCVE